jgi:hypothetical protein
MYRKKQAVLNEMINKKYIIIIAINKRNREDCPQTPGYKYSRGA